MVARRRTRREHVEVNRLIEQFERTLWRGKYPLRTKAIVVIVDAAGVEQSGLLTPSVLPIGCRRAVLVMGSAGPAESPR